MYECYVLSTGTSVNAALQVEMDRAVGPLYKVSKRLGQVSKSDPSVTCFYF